MSDFERALAALGAGQAIGLPTDTVYGVAADPFRQSAVAALFTAKGRSDIKPIPILVGDLAGARTVGVVDERVEAAAAKYWPGALTIIVRRRAGVPSWVGSEDRTTVGVRIPSHPIALEVLRAFGPLAATSANRSGQEPALDDRGARAALGEAISVYLPGMSGGGQPSTVVDLSGPTARILRSGPVEYEEQE